MNDRQFLLDIIVKLEMLIDPEYRKNDEVISYVLKCSDILDSWNNNVDLKLHRHWDGNADDLEEE